MPPFQCVFPKMDGTTLPKMMNNDAVSLALQLLLLHVAVESPQCVKGGHTDWALQV